MKKTTKIILVVFMSLLISNIVNHTNNIEAKVTCSKKSKSYKKDFNKRNIILYEKVLKKKTKKKCVYRNVKITKYVYINNVKLVAKVTKYHSNKKVKQKIIKKYNSNRKLTYYYSQVNFSNGKIKSKKEYSNYTKGIWQTYKNTAYRKVKNKSYKKQQNITKRNSNKIRLSVKKYYYNKYGILKSNKHGNAYLKKYSFFKNNKAKEYTNYTYDSKGAAKKTYYIYYINNKPKSNSTKNFKIFSHRGIPSQAISHTFEGYDKAISYGTKYIELDLVASLDDTLIVHHGQNLSETIANLDLDITQNNAEDILNKKYKNGENVKSVDDVFSKYGNSIHYIIETRHWDSYNINHDMILLNKINEYDLQDNIIIQSFNRKSLEYFKSQLPNVETVLLANKKRNINIHNELNTVDYIDSICYVFSILDTERINKTKAANKMIYSYTVNSYINMEICDNKKIDGIFTDYTDRAVKYFN